METVLIFFLMLAEPLKCHLASSNLPAGSHCYSKWVLALCTWLVILSEWSVGSYSPPDPSFLVTQFQLLMFPNLWSHFYWFIYSCWYLEYISYHSYPQTDFGLSSGVGLRWQSALTVRSLTPTSLPDGHGINTTPPAHTTLPTSSHPLPTDTKYAITN